MVTHVARCPKAFPPHEEEPMIEEREIASWRYKKGVLDAKTASLCYLAANLAVGNTT
jgi:hypothetical protein